jgi:hypothetical protein
VAAGPPSGVRLQAFEAFPRQVPLPADLGLAAPWCEQGGQVVVADDFTGPAGELDGRWERSVGEGRFERTGRGAGRVAAGRDRPNPGRTAYTVAWDDPDFADIEAELTPPGGARGEGHNGRGGLIIYQDPDNYLLVNMWLDDAPHHDGSSVSMFYRCAGYERLYDAVWTNVGRRVSWGRPFTMRLASDGRQVMVWVDGEPVLYRRLRDIYPTAAPLALCRVGLAANWEWGDDTGTEFRRFVARAR